MDISDLSDSSGVVLRIVHSKSNLAFAETTSISPGSISIFFQRERAPLTHATCDLISWKESFART